ncbi:MAG TPA: c-type cytochrome [Longimicrobium sp.]|nr:c-type cytochrome [Longimicrobium sp.]
MRIGVGMMLAVAALSACGGGDGSGGGSSAPRDSGGGRPESGPARNPGAELYAYGCAPCHATRGEGTQIGPALNDRAREVQQVVQAVTSGVPAVKPPHVPMPARGDGTWTDAQIRTVSEYVHSLAR